MVDYKNGKIYVIRNSVNDLVYIGSTTKALSERMAKHRSTYKREVVQNFPIYKAFKEIGVDKFYIELLEEHSCENIEQLHRKEGQYIREYNSLQNGYNQILAGRTKHELYIDTREKILERAKEYRDSNVAKFVEKGKQYRADNKDAISERKKKMTTCEICGSEHLLDIKKRHERTKKHQNALLKNQQA